MSIRFSAAALLAILSEAVFAAAENSAKQGLEPMEPGSVLQVVLSLLLVVGLIFGLAWLLRRVGHWGPGTAGAIRIIGGQSVGQRERIILVQVGEQQLLLGVAPGRVQTLHVLDKPVRVETGNNQGDNTFAKRFGEALRKGGRP